MTKLNLTQMTNMIMQIKKYSIRDGKWNKRGHFFGEQEEQMKEQMTQKCLK